MSEEKDLIEEVQKVLEHAGIEFQYVWDEDCPDGWQYVQCNLRFKPPPAP